MSIDVEEREFNAHLAHYTCEWCRASFGKEHAELIEKAHQQKLQNDNMRGTLRSYQMYQAELVRRIRHAEEEAEFLKRDLEVKESKWNEATARFKAKEREYRRKRRGK